MSDLRIKEAETCYAMGMLEEALELYEQVGRIRQVRSPAGPADARRRRSAG
ncbi:MAG: hypothetical protein MZU91_01600 [Desulfosudis oleivorans]|nr:hypothetical protein [Desulfosudis oleivorans]